MIHKTAHCFRVAFCWLVKYNMMVYSPRVRIQSRLFGRSFSESKNIQPSLAPSSHEELIVVGGFHVQWEGCSPQDTYSIIFPSGRNQRVVNIASFLGSANSPTSALACEGMNPVFSMVQKSPCPRPVLFFVSFSNFEN